MLHDAHAQFMLEAVANMRARGADVTRETVRVELEHRLEHKDLEWYDALVIEPKHGALMSKWEQRLVQLARKRKQAIAAAEPIESHYDDIEAEIDEFALRDVDYSPERVEHETLELERKREEFFASIDTATDSGGDGAEVAYHVGVGGLDHRDAAAARALARRRAHGPRRYGRHRRVATGRRGRRG